MNQPIGLKSMLEFHLYETVGLNVGLENKAKENILEYNNLKK